jgi:hypothetical protein
MSCKAKRLIAATVVTLLMAAVPAAQAITASDAVPLACQGGGSGCAG